MIEWLDDFYGDPDLKATMLRNFLPLFSDYVAQATGGPVAATFVQALAESYVDRHLGSSRAQLQEVVKGSPDPLADLQHRFDEWEEKRPGKVASNELVRSANAAAVEKMREAGVTKMVWRASGAKTCPFCTELDGTVISVEGTFFEAGDELNPEGATAPIHFESSLGHPPVHQGCVCSVESVIDSGAQQGLPGFDAPEFEVPQKVGYIDPQLRPNADVELAGMWDRTVDIHKNLVDRYNLDSGWDGSVRRINEGTAVAEFDGSISINVARMVKEPAIREHNLVHEVFHTLSNADEASFVRYPGWEEGLVDQLTVLNRQSVWDDIGVKLTAKQARDLAEFDGDSSYGLYRYAWENMRRSTSLEADDFYGQMLRTPLAGRPALATKLGVSDFDLQRGLQILGGAD